MTIPFYPFGFSPVSAIYDSAVASVDHLSAGADRTLALRQCLQDGFTGLSDRQIADGLPGLMERAFHDGEAVEGFWVAARRGLPQAFHGLFELDGRMIDRRPPENWRAPFEEAAMRAHNLLTSETDRDWLVQGALSGDTEALDAFKRLVLLQDRSPRSHGEDLSETNEQLAESRGLWLAFARMRRDPEGAANDLEDLVRSSDDARIRRLGATLLSLRCRDGLHNAYAAESLRALKNLATEKIPEALEGLLKAVDRTFAREMLDTLRDVARAGPYADDIAEKLFDLSWNAYQRACGVSPDLPASPIGRKMRHCSPAFDLLEALAKDDPRFQSRLDRLQLLLRRPLTKNS